MKVCKKCDAVQSDERRFCVDCGAVLGPPVDKKTAEEYNKKLGKKVNKMADSGDFLARKPLDTVCGIAMLVLAVISGIIFLFPKFAADGRSLFGIIFVMGILLGENALMPKVAWLIEKLRLSARVENTDDLVPSSWYIITRRLSIYGGALLIFTMFCFALTAAIRFHMMEDVTIIDFGDFLP